MPDETVAIARVPLARAPRRLVAAPLGAIAVGAAAAVLGVLLGGLAGIGLAIAGALTILLAAWLGLVLLTIRLDIDVSSVRVSWLGGERRYALVRGPVTRVALDGPQAVSLRARFGAFGWILGRATLRGEERIEIVRLAPTRSLILVPTEGIRLAIAPRSEGDLIAALTAAARVQQRLDAARPRVHLPVVRPEVERAPARMPALSETAEPAPRTLTGIERVELEERLAAQRAAALAAAEAERRAQEEARIAAAAAPIAPPRRERLGLPVPRPHVGRPAWTRPTRAALVPLAVLLVPLAGAAVAWAVALASGQDRSASVQNLVLALMLAGPGATLAAIAVRFWRPRLVPLVVGSALFALVLVGGSLVPR
jgi:hypothetical protein